ncbi:hypothetical protein, variant 1 [Aphanomyces astaci]|uniref:Uncharacterized protein n=1 Tax=Aphanomyces astaci TaxID=112090 RepID=W4HE13_APHAT|nr:hypothetical protein, variant 1 [Aphanomyces astaci]ETV89393.1 hypothetical protein, variant 1 [Aphanomyces astaci]|eukprot:XP_009821793.1 hypothetical protein, variant 1 [Aphanomyces astaci]
MVAEDGESLGRYASYGFVLSSMLHATGKDEFMATSEVYRWKLRCIRTKIRHQQFDDDVSFLRDVQVLLMCVSSQLVRESLSCKVLSSMATVGLGNELPVPEARHIPNKHVLATGATPTMPLLDSILRRDVQLALKQKAYSASALQASIAALEAVESPRPLDLSKVHPSLLRRTSSMIKPKKPADPSTRKPYVDGRRVYIPLEPEISDKRELKLLQSRRPQVEVNMCPHLQGQLVTVYSAKRDRFVSDQALGELRDGRVYDIPSKRLLTLERFFATHVRANRNGRPAAQHICLLAPTRQSLDLHLLASVFERVSAHAKSLDMRSLRRLPRRGRELRRDHRRGCAAVQVAGNSPTDRDRRRRYHPDEEAGTKARSIEEGSGHVDGKCAKDVEASVGRAVAASSEECQVPEGRRRNGVAAKRHYETSCTA